MLKIGIYVSKFEIEKFNCKKNFNLWQTRVKELLVQWGLHIAGKSAKPADTLDEN